MPSSTLAAPVSGTTAQAPGKWPKVLPPLTPEQKRINDDFMAYWHEVLPRSYGAADRFCHRYVVKHAARQFQRTLEVGAGLGEHLHYEKLSPEQTREYVALDMRPNMVEKIKARFPEVAACVGDCQARLNFPDGYFDRIIAINVLEHLPDLPRALQELHRLCNRQSGMLSAVIPCEGGLAYGIARRISAQRIFQKRYPGVPYKQFIGREHINVPWEIYEELDRYFVVDSRRFYPFPLPFEFCNLFIGLNLRPR